MAKQKCFTVFVKPDSLRFVRIWVGLAGHVPVRLALVEKEVQLMLKNLIFTAIAVPLFVVASGCSSLGLTLWPAQFPLMNQTKQLAAQSPMPSGLPHELSKTVIPSYYLEPGDRVLLEPAALDSAFMTIGDQKIQVDGTIDLGKFGRMRVVGMTVEDVEAAIHQRLQEVNGHGEMINVQLVEPNASEIYVLGEVGSPGSYPLEGNETVLDAILRAGGLTSSASPCDMILVRPTNPCDCRVVLPVCYRQITQLGDVTTNYQLQPGDRIVVGARTLREELSFWKQATSCPRCAGKRCVECKPANVNYFNRFTRWLPFSQASSEAIDEAPQQAAEAAPAANVPQEATSSGTADDSDVFLPELPAESLPPSEASPSNADSGASAPPSVSRMPRLSALRS